MDRQTYVEQNEPSWPFLFVLERKNESRSVRAVKPGHLTSPSSNVCRLGMLRYRGLGRAKRGGRFVNMEEHTAAHADKQTEMSFACETAGKVYKLRTKNPDPTAQAARFRDVHTQWFVHAVTL